MTVMTTIRETIFHPPVVCEEFSTLPGVPNQIVSPTIINAATMTLDPIDIGVLEIVSNKIHYTIIVGIENACHRFQFIHHTLAH
jgi:hypothetical protein